jgi:AcrR family transcriptional regulator
MQTMTATRAVRRSPAAGASGRRVRERTARRTEILSAAREVFARHGYEHATLDDIARKAEFAKGTLYNYFRSKEDLFRQLVEVLLDDMEGIATGTAALTLPPREIFHEYARRMFVYYRENEDFLRIVMVELHRLQVEDKRSSLRHVLDRIRNVAGTLGAVLVRRTAAKRLNGEDPRELAQVFVAIIHNRALRRSLETDGLRKMDADREAAFLTRLFFEGAGAP